MPKNINVKPFDFSQTAVKKAVIRNTVEHPLVLYPAVLSVLGFFSIGVFGFSPLSITVAASGFGIAVVTWLVNYGLRRNKFANAYVNKLHQKMEQRRQSHIRFLETALADVQSTEGQSQFKRLGEKFAIFETILAKKLNPHELTYGRYLGMAEQVYLGAIDNLQHVTNTLKSLQAINADYLQQRLETLQTMNPRTVEVEQEIASLTQRQILYDKQYKNVTVLLAQNEEAMTKLDVTIAAINDMRTEDGSATMDIETAMNELQRLANRAKDYSNN